ncbi:MAG TPA: endo alpha-1,4 polygalactosaminidase [Thermoleophilaceae bacterium]|nr:endo alpha-1,4 polygalactosaminidase [Thermoleophilaceae bacterium]
MLPLLLAAAIWSPAPTADPWQYQLQGKVDLSVRAGVYAVDGADTPKRTVRRIHDRGARAVCYLSAGSYENWRADRRRFPDRVIGRPLAGWPGERWLDIRSRGVLLPIMHARMERCARKGFDAVDPDNVEGYRHPTGFPLSAHHQRRYNRALARAAHDLGLAIGLKNDLGQVRQLVSDFDFAINEQCFQYRECRRLRPFIRAGKPVFNVEYKRLRCGRAHGLSFSTIRKRLSLRAWRRTC